MIFEEMKQTIEELCSIESVQAEPLPGKPFGENVYKALTYFLNKAEKMGFKAINYDGYVGEVIWQGSEPASAENELGILCHLDVVKAGRLADWKYPPFEATEADGKIYARGVLDDKGPAVAVLYMMKELKDEGFVPKKTIRFIVGCNEESGWKCIEHYKSVAKLPEYGFSPDGNFPVVYAEKGIIHARYQFDCDRSLTIRGGEMPNMVCDYAYATSPLFSGEMKDRTAKLCSALGLKIENDKIESFGLCAHGSAPECGKNAMDPLIKCLSELGLVEKSVYRSLFEDFYHLKDLEDESGKLTMSPDIITAENGKMSIVVDFRYPSKLDPDKAEILIGQIGKYEIMGNHQKPLFVDKNSELVQKLLAAYNRESGLNAEPIAIGGGTYARALKCGVAFGPEFPGEDAPVHQPNEYLSLANLEKMCRIYKASIKSFTA